MMSASETFNYENFYNNLDGDFIPLDIYTAASLGEVSFFMKCNVGEPPVINLSGWSALMYACSRGHSLLVNYLLLSGAKKSCKTRSGVTPLMLAVSSGDLSTVENVYDFSNLEERDYRKWTPLFYAVHFTREKCVQYLLIKGADVNIVDFQNETPLMVAIKLKRETMVELLLKSAKNLDVVSYKQESALMLADESNNVKIQKMVREHYKNLKRNKSPIQSTVTKTPAKHSSPTPIKQQLKFQSMMSRSLTYSPNKVAPRTPKTLDVNLWKRSFQKKFWSPQLKPYNDVEKFLKSLGMEKYWPIFRDEEVDFETLLTLNEENLKELGIVLFGPRKKIYLAIQKLRNCY